MTDAGPSEEIILDACCIINLFGSGCVCEILRALPARFWIAKFVYEREALYTLVDPASDQRERINLDSLISEQIIRIVDLDSEDEAATLVDLVTTLEDGEAHTCALALHRGFIIATDERKVLNLIRKSMPSLRTRTTTELIKSWADVADPPEKRLGDVLRRVRSHARFVPSRQDPLWEWWIALVGRG